MSARESPAERIERVRREQASSPEAYQRFQDAEAAVRAAERANGGKALPSDHPAMVEVRAAHDTAFTAHREADPGAM